MAKGEPCGVCGETETKLVDGYYYCAECGTQDTHLQETIVEHQALADGTIGIASRSRYSIKIKEGVKMSPEWYKWHRHNFLLAGLTEQLIELGAAPSVRMKVLWIWTRYIKRYQKKDEMGPSHALNQLQERSSSSEDEVKEEEAERKEEELMARLRKGTWALNRVSSYVALTILALALNIDRSPILVSHITRFARFRLLTVTDVNRLVPLEILDNSRRLGYSPARLFYAIPYMMAQLAKHLDLGPPVTPDIEQMLLSQLRELRLPRGLAQLVRALMRLAPVTINATSFKQADDECRFPDYEAAVMAYVVIALKMCFGLDDDYEKRLSDAVERVNEESNHPRAYSSAPEPTPRLFSFRAWAAHLELRALQLTRHYAPLAWLRGAVGAVGAQGGAGAGAGGAAALEHFQQFTSARNDPRVKGKRKGAKARVTDQVTMEILGKIPQRFDVGVLSLDELKPAAAALEPQLALSRAVAPLLGAAQRALLDEDFTQYSLDYAYRHLGLPGAPSSGLFRGVRVYADRRNKKVAEDLYARNADETIVYIKNCSNKNWARTERPTTSRIVDDDDDGSDSRETAPDEEETKSETFEEEKEGANIYDDDFADVQIKEEKSDLNDDADLNDETKVETDRINEFENFNDANRGSCDNRSDDELPDFLDSDEENAPPFDPGTFDRREVIKEIMGVSYKKLQVNVPVRFLTETTVPKERKKEVRPSKYYKRREYQYGVGTDVWAKRQKRQDSKANIESIIATYRGNLQRDTLHQVEEQVRASTHAGDRHPPEPEPLDIPHLPDPVDISHTDPMDVDDGDVEIIENDGKNDENIEDEFDEHAYDPIFKSDTKFDEKTHDIDQLFLKMPELPREEPRADDDDDDDVTAIIDKQILRRKKVTPKPKKKPQLITTDIDHLVDDPERIEAYNYWVAEVAATYKKYLLCQYSNWKFEKDIKESSPRSFYFVLRECAAAIGLRPTELYMLSARVEEALISLLPVPPKKRGRSKKSDRIGVTLKTSENRQPKKRGRPRKNVDLSVTLGSPGLHSNSRLPGSGPVLQNKEPRKIERPGMHMTVNLSAGSDLQKKPDDGKTLHSQQNWKKTVKPQKNLDLSSSDWQMSASESSSSDSSSEGALRNQEQPRKRGRPRKQDDDLLVTSDLQKSKEGKTAHSQQHWKKRGRPRKKNGGPLESGDFIKRLSSSDSSSEGALRKQEQPRKRGRPRKQDDDLLVTSDLQKSKEGKTAHSQQILKKRGRPRKNNGGPLESGDLQDSTIKRLSSYSNSSREIPKKRGRPRKNNVGVLSESSDSLDSTSESSSSYSDSSPEIPRKIGRARKSYDGNLLGASDSQEPEARLREDGTTVHSPQNQRNRGKSRKNLVRDHSEKRNSLERTSVSPSSYLDWSEDDEIALRNPEQPWNREGFRKSMDGSLSNASDLAKKPNYERTLDIQQTRRKIGELSDTQESTLSSS